MLNYWPNARNIFCSSDTNIHRCIRIAANDSILTQTIDVLVTETHSQPICFYNAWKCDSESYWIDNYDETSTSLDLPLWFAHNCMRRATHEHTIIVMHSHWIRMWWCPHVSVRELTTTNKIKRNKTERSETETVKQMKVFTRIKWMKKKTKKQTKCKRRTQLPANRFDGELVELVQCVTVSLLDDESRYKNWKYLWKKKQKKREHKKTEWKQELKCTIFNSKDRLFNRSDDYVRYKFVVPSNSKIKPTKE